MATQLNMFVEHAKEELDQELKNSEYDVRLDCWHSRNTSMYITLPKYTLKGRPHKRNRIWFRVGSITEATILARFIKDLLDNTIIDISQGELIRKLIYISIYKCVPLKDYDFKRLVHVFFASNSGKELETLIATTHLSQIWIILRIMDKEIRSMRNTVDLTR